MNAINFKISELVGKGAGHSKASLRSATIAAVTEAESPLRSARLLIPSGSAKVEAQGLGTISPARRIPTISRPQFGSPSGPLERPQSKP